MKSQKKVSLQVEKKMVYKFIESGSKKRINQIKSNQIKMSRRILVREIQEDYTCGMSDVRVFMKSESIKECYTLRERDRKERKGKKEG